MRRGPLIDQAPHLDRVPLVVARWCAAAMLFALPVRSFALIKVLAIGLLRAGDYRVDTQEFNDPVKLSQQCRVGTGHAAPPPRPAPLAPGISTTSALSL